MNEIKYAISNIAWDGTKDSIVYDLMNKYGFSGLEIAPTRLFPQNPYDNLENAYSWKKQMEERYGFSIPSMQSIWYGRTENIFNDQKDRQVLIDYTKRAIDFAEKLNCRNLVFGCPRNRNMPENADKRSAVSFFREIGEYALERGTVIALEANPPIYNTNFINNTLSAIDFIQEVDCQGFQLNLDIGTMIENKETVENLERCIPYISHVHISEPGLKILQKRELHKQIYSFLKQCGYKRYVSVEMGKVEDISLIEEIMEYIQNIFGKNN